MNDSFSAASQRATAPFRYDIVGSFLRSEPLKEARQRFAQARLKTSTVIGHQLPTTPTGSGYTGTSLINLNNTGEYLQLDMTCNPV